MPISPGRKPTSAMTMRLRWTLTKEKRRTEISSKPCEYGSNVAGVTVRTAMMVLAPFPRAVQPSVGLFGQKAPPEANTGSRLTGTKNTGRSCHDVSGNSRPALNDDSCGQSPTPCYSFVAFDSSPRASQIGHAVEPALARRQTAFESLLASIGRRQ